MNRHERRAVRAAARQELDHEQVTKLLASLVETIGISIPGYGVTIMITRDSSDEKRADVKYASTEDWPKVRAVMAGLVDARPSGSVGGT